MSYIWASKLLDHSVKELTADHGTIQRRLGLALLPLRLISAPDDLPVELHERFLEVTTAFPQLCAQGQELLDAVAQAEALWAEVVAHLIRTLHADAQACGNQR